MLIRVFYKLFTILIIIHKTAAIYCTSEETQLDNSEFKKPITKEFIITSNPGLALSTYQLVYDFQKVMDHYEIPFFYSYGTLLGSVRHGGMIQWDDDADCCVLEKDFKKIIHILPVFSKLGYSYRIPDDGFWKGIKIYKPDVLDLDIFVMNLKSGLYSCPTGFPRDRLKHEQIFPIQKVQFGSIQISAPQDINGILTGSYGSDWNTHGVKYNHSFLKDAPRMKILLDSNELLPAGPFGPLVDNTAIIAEKFVADLEQEEAFNNEIFDYKNRNGNVFINLGAVLDN